jgi:hypothetical protein
MSAERDFKLLRSLLAERIERVNQEVRNYPQPIAHCDDQLNKLLEQRARLAGHLDRISALVDSDLSRGDRVRLIEELLTSPSGLDDETEEQVRSRLRAALPRSKERSPA